MKLSIYNEPCEVTINRAGCVSDDAIIVTDPPFNVGYHYDVCSDNMDDNAYFDMLKRITAGRRHVLIHYPESIYRYCVHAGITPNRVVSWVYNSNTRRHHRDIAFFGFTPDFSGFLQPYKNLSDKRIIDRINNGHTGTPMYDWFYCDQIKNVYKNKMGITHPCIMPSDVMDRIVALLPKGSFVYDPFCGSGTTLISCAARGIDCCGSEISNTYFNECVERVLHNTNLRLQSSGSNYVHYEYDASKAIKPAAEHAPAFCPSRIKITFGGEELTPFATETNPTCVKVCKETPKSILDDF